MRKWAPNFSAADEITADRRRPGGGRGQENCQSWQDAWFVYLSWSSYDVRLSGNDDKWPTLSPRVNRQKINSFGTLSRAVCRSYLTTSLLEILFTATKPLFRLAPTGVEAGLNQERKFHRRKARHSTWRLDSNSSSALLFYHSTTTSPFDNDLEPFNKITRTGVKMQEEM
jgi:hypothetical protein